MVRTFWGEGGSDLSAFGNTKGIYDNLVKFNPLEKRGSDLSEFGNIKGIYDNLLKINSLGEERFGFVCLR